MANGREGVESGHQESHQEQLHRSNLYLILLHWEAYSGEEDSDPA